MTNGTNRIKVFAVASAMAATAVLSGGGTQAWAGDADEVSASAKRDCAQGYLCLWGKTNFERGRGTWSVKATESHRCGKGVWKPRNPKRFARSAWNRTTKVWYGKTGSGTERQIVRKTGMYGSLIVSIPKSASITQWCWKKK